ncbi:hypothetical protein Y032_0003g1472 [Ancylostoma ceylanicum]|uniref:Uncharacterized protein n=1 Tax=Ancylostoma ceylanicum TaxID=53326 RepID=A0A016VXU0_9BILA|nr:hypothetical protein Y032_0003g1472 [Ancylostoma ceylanicum]
MKSDAWRIPHDGIDQSLPLYPLLATKKSYSDKCALGTQPKQRDMSSTKPSSISFQLLSSSPQLLLKLLFFY